MLACIVYLVHLLLVEGCANHDALPAGAHGKHLAHARGPAHHARALAQHVDQLLDICGEEANEKVMGIKESVNQRATKIAWHPPCFVPLEHRQKSERGNPEGPFSQHGTEPLGFLHIWHPEAQTIQGMCRTGRVRKR